MKKLSVAFALIFGLGLAFSAPAKAQEQKDIDHCNEIKAQFIKTDGLMKSLFENAHAYVIFPSIGKGAVGVGGATGNGIVFEKGKPIGKVNLSQLTVGMQAGGKVYSEVIFFENNEPLQRLKDNKFEFSGQASAVALKAGVSTNIKYADGVMVFTSEKGGLMYEASIGGQKFTYKPFDAADAK